VSEIPDTNLLPSVITPSDAWLQGRDEQIELAVGIEVIENDDEFQAACRVTQELKALAKQLKAARMTITRQYDAQKKVIMDHEKEIGAEVAAQIARLEPMANKWHNDRRLEAEAERRRIEQEERERVEAEAARIAEAEAAAADAQNAAADFFGVSAPDVEPIIEPEPAPFVPPAAPVVVPTAPKPAAGSARVRIKNEITSPAEVPRELCEPSQKKINAFIKFRESQGETAEQIDKSLPGVRVWAESKISAR
jgi:hypothetical protein